MSASTKRKSPLKTIPLRQAGDSVSERLLDTSFDQGVRWLCVFIAGLFTTMTVVALWIDNSLPSHIFMLVIGIGAMSIGTWKLSRLPHAIHPFRLGAKGERAVADVLQDLATTGHRAIHDLQFDNFNVDHVLVGPSGILLLKPRRVARPMFAETPSGSMAPAFSSTMGRGRMTTYNKPSVRRERSKTCFADTWRSHSACAPSCSTRDGGLRGRIETPPSG